MHLERTAAAAALVLLAASAATAQVPTEGEHNADLSGVWTNVNLPGTAEWAIYTFTKDLRNSRILTGTGDIDATSAAAALAEIRFSELAGSCRGLIKDMDRLADIDSRAMIVPSLNS